MLHREEWRQELLQTSLEQSYKPGNKGVTSYKCLKKKKKKKRSTYSDTSLQKYKTKKFSVEQKPREPTPADLLHN